MEFPRDIFCVSQVQCHCVANITPTLSALHVNGLQLRTARCAKSSLSFPAKFWHAGSGQSQFKDFKVPSRGCLLYRYHCRPRTPIQKLFKFVPINVGQEVESISADVKGSPWTACSLSQAQQTRALRRKAARTFRQKRGFSCKLPVGAFIIERY